MTSNRKRKLEDPQNPSPKRQKTNDATIHEDLMHMNDELTTPQPKKKKLHLALDSFHLKNMKYFPESL